MGWGRVEPTDFIVFGWELSWVGLNLIGNIPLGCRRGRATFLVTLTREFPNARSPRCALGITVDLAVACSSLALGITVARSCAGLLSVDHQIARRLHLHVCKGPFCSSG